MGRGLTCLGGSLCIVRAHGPFARACAKKSATLYKEGCLAELALFLDTKEYKVALFPLRCQGRVVVPATTHSEVFAASEVPLESAFFSTHIELPPVYPWVHLGKGGCSSKRQRKKHIFWSSKTVFEVLF